MLPSHGTGNSLNEKIDNLPSSSFTVNRHTYLSIWTLMVDRILFEHESYDTIRWKIPLIITYFSQLAMIWDFRCHRKNVSWRVSFTILCRLTARVHHHSSYHRYQLHSLLDSIDERKFCYWYILLTRSEMKNVFSRLFIYLQDYVVILGPPQWTLLISAVVRAMCN